MDNTLLISATLDQPGFLEDLVEKLAYRHYDIGYSKAAVPKNWKAIETSSTETYVSGTLAMDLSVNEKTREDHIDLPFITSFLFTCIKGEKEPYQLIWSSSLS